MSRFVAGVVVAEAFALWLEFFYKFGLKWNPGAFLISIPLYFIFISLLHLVFGRLEGRRGHRPLCFILGGVSGLLLEWFLVGNSPWNNPKAIQSAQFLFHAVYPLLGYLLVRVAPVKRAALRKYMLVWTVITAIAFLFPASGARSLWFLFMPLLAYLGLCYFVVKLARSAPRHADARLVDHQTTTITS